MNPGMELRIPILQGVIHDVQAGETLADIANQYGVAEADIRSLAENNIQQGEPSAGQVLLVPNPTRLASGSVILEQAWSEDAVWHWGATDVWDDHCDQFPPRQGDPCIQEVMRADGASPQAIEFYELYGYLLRHFVELGQIDFGRSSSPWLNMGRPAQLYFLNGFPPVIDVNGSLYGQFQSLKVGEFSSQPDGGLSITIRVPLKAGRPASPSAYMPVLFVFTKDGALLDSRYLALQQP